jgi:hypothetical protein
MRPYQRAAYDVDWPYLLGQLRARSRRPLARWGRLCGIDEQTMNRLARGEISEPRYSAALVLLDAANDVLGAVVVGGAWVGRAEVGR